MLQKYFFQKFQDPENRRRKNSRSLQMQKVEDDMYEYESEEAYRRSEDNRSRSRNDGSRRRDDLALREDVEKRLRDRQLVEEQGRGSSLSRR